MADDAAPTRTHAALSAAGRVGRGWWAALGLASVLAAVLLVHLPVIANHYFFGDDFVPLAEASALPAGDYIKNLFLMDDITPNWRFLTGAYYLLVFEISGANAAAFLTGAVLVHMGTAALVFWLVWRATASGWAATFAAGLFGLSAASVPTVGQVTAFNNVLAAFLTVLSIVLMYEAFERGRMALWAAFSLLAFAGAIAANESAAMLAPVPPLVALWRCWQRDAAWWQVPRELITIGSITAAFAVVGGAALIGFAACGCTEAAADPVFGGGDHIFGNLGIFAGQVLWPVDMEGAPGEIEAAHLIAALVVLAIGAVAAVRGPALARIAVVLLLLSLLPYLPLRFALAPRYVYMPTVAFAIIAALLALDLGRYAARYSPLLVAPIVVAGMGVLALESSQTWELNEEFEEKSEVWRDLADGLEANYPELPAGSKVYVRGHALSDPLFQFTVLPSMGEALYGRGVVLAELPRETKEVCEHPGGEVYVLDYDDGVFTPARIVTADGDLASDEARVVECEQPGIGTETS